MFYEFRCLSLTAQAVARELFSDRKGKIESAKVGNAKLRSSLELERFLSRKEAFSTKKNEERSSPD